MTLPRWGRHRASALAGLSLAALLAFQPKPPTFNRLPSGTEYRIYKLVKGKYVRQPALPPAGEPTYAQRVGQIMAMHIEYRTAKDSVLMKSRKQLMDFPVRMPLQAVTDKKGTIEEALALLQAGDSAVFRFNADTLSLKTGGQPAPPFVKRHGNTISVFVKVKAIQTEAEAMAAQQQDMAAMQTKMEQKTEAQKGLDDKAIQEYLQKNQLQAQKTAGGTYVVLTQPGTGAKPTSGQTVAVRYSGSVLSTGKVFDASERHGGTPFEFALGQHQVIPGWDEGIAELPQGSKALLLIPSGQGYGARGAGADIPPYAVLRFEVELVGVK